MTDRFISYAQNFEDVRLWRAFSDVSAGRYLDVGTQDPVRDSVSLAFYERGWRGIHIEPTPSYAAAMRAARPDELVIEAAVSTAPGPIRFFEIPQTGLSTGVPDIAEHHAGIGWPVQEITVPTVTLAGLFDLMGEEPIHWLKIDVEGMEADVLASWGDHPARPAALIIEATIPNTQIQTHDAWYELVLSRGYSDVLFDGLSRYFIHETHAQRGAALALSPNVFDGFHVVASHFVAGQLVAENEAALAALRTETGIERDAAVATAQAEHEAALQAVRAELERRIAEAQTALDEALAAQEQLRGQAEADQQAAVATAQAEHEAALKAVRADLEHRIAEAQTALDEALAAQEQLRAQAEADQQATVTALQVEHEAALQILRTKLEGRIAAAQAGLEEARAAQAAQQLESQSLAREVGQLQGRLTAQGEIAAARQRDAETLRQHLASQLETVKQQWMEAETELRQVRAACRRLENRLGQSEGHHRALQDQLAGYRHELQVRAGENAAQSREIAATRQQLIEGETQLAAAEARRTALVAEIDQLLADAERLRQQLQASEARAKQAEARETALAADLAELQTEAAWHAQQLAQAADLLAHQPDAIAGWPRRLATALARLAGRQPDEIAAGHTASIEAWRAGPTAQTQKVPLEQKTTIAKNPCFVDIVACLRNYSMPADESPITSVPRLLAPHDEEFIRVAYQAVLGRAPDPEGHTYYLGRLREGIHKLEILRQLRRSPEGRNFIPGVAGLDKAIRRHRRANLPLIGFLIRLWAGAESNGATARQIRALRNELWVTRVQNLQPDAAPADERTTSADTAAQSALAGQLETFRANTTASYVIDDFMHLYDANFVRFAYRCILKREPDPIGLQHYVNKVRQGISRTQIIHDLRHSKEGQERGVIISGLSTSYTLEKIMNLPFIGGILHFIMFNINIKWHIRDLRNMENQIHRLSSAIGKYDV